MSKQDKYKWIFSMMLLIRRFEEKSAQLYGMGKIAGFCHLYTGQEAIAVGAIQASKKNDNHVTSYRDHGHILALGGDPAAVMAELMGKATGYSKGKGGSMHMFDPERNFYGGHGIVGAQVPIGTGIAFASKYQGKKDITYVYYGDGAAHQGQVYEAFNLAKLWKLPVVYIIENNKYALGTSTERSTAITDLYKRGESFGIPGKRIDGMDVLKVEEAILEASDYVRQGKGPFLIEAKTYRYRGHSMSDPAKYRTKEEVDKYKEHYDPINTFKKFLLSKKHLTESELKEMESSVKAKVAKAVEFAEQSPEPDIKELYTDVYVE